MDNKKIMMIIRMKRQICEKLVKNAKIVKKSFHQPILLRFFDSNAFF